MSAGHLAGACLLWRLFTGSFTLEVYLAMKSRSVTIMVRSKKHDDDSVRSEV